MTTLATETPMVLGTVPTRRRRVSPAGGRFDPQVIAARLEHARQKYAIDVKEIAAAIWPHQDEPRFTWYKKVNRRMSDFDLAELGLAVEFIARRAGKALHGFPFVDEALADQLEPKRKG